MPRRPAFPPTTRRALVRLHLLEQEHALGRMRELRAIVAPHNSPLDYAAAIASVRARLLLLSKEQLIAALATDVELAVRSLTECDESKAKEGAK